MKKKIWNEERNRFDYFLLFKIMEFVRFCNRQREHWKLGKILYKEMKRKKRQLSTIY